MKFSVIIPSKDRKEILEHNLERVAKAKNLNDLQIIIINDSDKELFLDKRFNFVTIYRNEFGGGVASARNFGASKATNDWLIFMDDDMWVEPDTFSKLVSFTQYEDRCLNVDWVYPLFLNQQLPYKPFLRYLNKYGFDSLEGWSSDVVWKRNHAFQVNGITSQFLLIHKRAFNKVGGYNISFPFAGFEDHDMSKRLKQNDIPVYVDPNNIIFHNEADRLDVENWLERKKRGGITRRVAVHFEHKDLVLHYSFLKRIIYSGLYACRWFILPILQSWPRTKRLDSFYFLLVNLMLGTYSYKGYTSQDAQHFISKSKSNS